MPTCQFSALILFTCLLLAAGCKDREIATYRAPKDPAPPPALSGASMAGQLPEGHPPIGQSTNPGPAGALPEGHPPIGQMGAMPDGSTPTVAAGNALTWTAPAHWQAKPPGPVRKGSYNVPGDAGAVGDLAITAFPGDTGGLFANINRWRGQVGLPPIEESQLDPDLEHLDVNSFHIVLVDMLGSTNGQGTRIIGAIVPHEGQTWFFKFTGPDALVAREKPAFREFLSTIKAR